MNLIASVDIDLATFSTMELPAKKNFRMVQAKLETLWAKVNQSTAIAQFAYEKIGIGIAQHRFYSITVFLRFKVHNSKQNSLELVFRKLAVFSASMWSEPSYREAV